MELEVVHSETSASSACPFLSVLLKILDHSTSMASAKEATAVLARTLGPSSAECTAEEVAAVAALLSAGQHHLFADWPEHPSASVHAAFRGVAAELLLAAACVRSVRLGIWQRRRPGVPPTAVLPC